MSRSFTKLFSSITESTVWTECSDTRVVWVTMLAMCDRLGRVWASIPGLARRANVPLKACEAALRKFHAPDQYSRTKDNDGRRIKTIEGGWQLLNYAYYRALQDVDDKREADAARQRKHYHLHKGSTGNTNGTSRNLTLPNVESRDLAQADADAEKKKDSAASRLSGFEHFWKIWPKRVAKAAAEKAWNKLAPDDALQVCVHRAVLAQAASPEWLKDGGRFIPHPATWINGRRWEDQPARAHDGVRSVSAAELAP